MLAKWDLCSPSVRQKRYITKEDFVHLQNTRIFINKMDLILHNRLVFIFSNLLFISTSKHSGRSSVARLLNEPYPFRPHPVTLISGFLPFLE